MVSLVASPVASLVVEEDGGVSEEGHLVGEDSSRENEDYDVMSPSEMNEMK